MGRCFPDLCAHFPVSFWLWFDGKLYDKRSDTFSLLHKEIKRSFKLLKHYWIVTTPFIVLALLLGKFAWSWESLILTASTLRCDWCPNAWFVSLYIELILLFPFFVYLINGRKIVHVVIGFLLIVLATKFIGKQIG